MALKIFNTMTRRKEEFVSLKPHFVRMYTCGLTVYDYMHIGHARTYCFWDVLRRWLKVSGYQVVSVINYTDIEDKIIARSNESGIPVEELSEKFISAFDDDIRWLGIEPWTITCRATDFVQEMIEMVQALVEKGFGYVIDGDVYFSVEKFRGYGKLSGHNLDDLIAGSRVEVDERKRNPADFALWKSAKEGEPFWDSPWGKGRPGWHIECSVMSMNYLGETFDIHGGAVDNMFPHHENEIAQSESYTGKPFAKYWMHPEHLLMEGTKMSKSLGNFVTVHELRRRRVNQRAVRLYFLMNHYRTQMNFSDDGLKAAKANLERIEDFLDGLGYRMVAPQGRRALGGVGDWLTDRLAAAARDFNKAMDDDLNTPAALATIFALIKEVNSRPDIVASAPGNASALSSFVKSQLQIVGMKLRRHTSFVDSSPRPRRDPYVAAEIAKRNEARARKDFKEADAIRDRLAEMGIILEDTSSGTRWHVKPASGAE